MFNKLKNQAGEVVLVAIAIGMIWGAIATIFVHQVKNDKFHSVTATP